VTELGRALGQAPFGEKVTVSGLPVSEAVIGDKWALGSMLLQLAQPPLPWTHVPSRGEEGERDASPWAAIPR
jgi:MOSC domain-containing protein YiiM